MRARGAAAKAYLSLRLRLSSSPIWFDRGCIKLPYHGGDIQELYYYLDAKEFWDEEMRSVSPFLTEGDVAVDVGANMGLMSGLFSKLTGPTGQVHTFEPSPMVYARLLDVINVNRYTNISPYNMGCGSQSQFMTLYRSPCSGSSTLRPEASPVKTFLDEQTVAVVKLDDFLGPKLERLDFLKIDTEGYEDEVLLGATSLLQRFKPIVYIELGSMYLASSERAIRLLREHGYTFDREVDLQKTYGGVNFIATPPVQKS
jgi:FkbM family methyltransferase